MNILEVINYRQSVRKYIDKAIEPKVQEEIDKFISSIKVLNPDISVLPMFLTKEDITSSITAPFFIAFYSENKEGYETNAGFILGQIELFLQTVGLGACFIGMGKPKANIVAPEGMEFVILLGYGYPDGKLYRDSDKFKRKDILKITNVDNEITQIARLTPSGMNLQPWYLSVNAHQIDVYKRSPLISPGFVKKMNLFDVGIVTLYLYLALNKEHKDVQFIKDNSDSDSIKGDYIISLKFE
jgi:nitroreductase